MNNSGIKSERDILQVMKLDTMSIAYFENEMENNFYQKGKTYLNKCGCGLSDSLLQR